MTSYESLGKFQGRRARGPDISIGILDPSGDSCGLATIDGAFEVSHPAPLLPNIFLRSSQVEPGLLIANATGRLGRDTGLEVCGLGFDWGPVFPFDLAEAPPATNVIPNATAVVLYTLHNSPFGDIKYVDHFVDGHLESRDVGSEPPWDVHIETTYADSVEGLSSPSTVLERVRGAKVHGEDFGKLMLVAGLYDSAEVTARRSARIALGVELANLARSLWD